MDYLQQQGIEVKVIPGNDDDDLNVTLNFMLFPSC